MAKNITISLQDDVLKAGREYARKHNLSLNAFIRELLARVVFRKSTTLWLEECFRLMNKAKASSKGKRWKRDDLYRG